MRPSFSRAVSVHACAAWSMTCRNHWRPSPGVRSWRGCWMCWRRKACGAVLATGYLGEKVEAALGKTCGGMSLLYSRETEPLGTGGAIVLAAQRIEGDAFFVVNGDTWLTLDYAAFDAATRRVNARLGIALAAVPDVSRYGAVRVDEGRVTGFAEKGRAGPGYINAGVYWLRRTLLDNFSKLEHFSFEAKVLAPTVSRELVSAYTCTAGFIDIGVPEDYRRVQTLFASLTGGAA